MEISAPIRVFKFGSLRLRDPDPSRPVEAIRDLLAENHPHLANAVILDGRLEGDELVFEMVGEPVKTKG